MITGYQTLEDRGNPTEIEAYGPFKCDRPNAWLGPGYYFWDSLEEWAHQWGYDAYIKKGSGYVICSAEIENEPDIMWDLFGSPLHQKEFREALEMIEESGYYDTGEPIKVSDVILYMIQKGVFHYKSVRAADKGEKTLVIGFTKWQKNGQPVHQMEYGQRVQICLLEKSEVTLRAFTIIYPIQYCS